MRKWRAAFLVSFFLSVGMIGPARGAEEARLALNWIVTTEHVGFHVAFGKGLWKVRGLEVAMSRGFGSGDTLKRLVGGREHFGFADYGTLVMARARGTKAKAIGAGFATNMHSLFALKGSGIQKPADLKGKSVGCPAASSVKVIFPSFARVNNIDPESVKWIPMGADALSGALLAGKADLICTYISEGPLFEEAAKKIGKSIRLVNYADWGIDIYSNGLVTLDETIAKKADFVRRFVGAALEGWAWAIKNPEEALQISLKRAPESNVDVARARLKLILQSVVDDGVAKNGIGYMDRVKMQRTHDVTLQNSDLRDVKIPVDELYSNAFLPGVKVR